MERSKPWYYSKTHWANILGIVIIAVPLLTEYKIVRPEIAGLVLGFVNIALRQITSKPLSLK